MLVYGKNVEVKLLKSTKKINKLYISENFSDKNIISLIEKRKINPILLDKKSIHRFDNYSHQGIILDIEDFVYSDIDEIILEKDKSIVLILDHIEDPHNLGAIIRTCEAAGVDGIIIPKDRSVSVNSTVMKTSAGALENVKISMVTNLGRTIDYLKSKGYWIIGTDMDGVDYKTLDYSGKICLIIGNEGKGMSKSISEACDFIAQIPMNGKINSLNASVAAGIIIFEAVHTKK